MAKFMNFFFLMSILSTLSFSSTANAKKFENSKAAQEQIDDQFYMVVVSNPKDYQKRQENETDVSIDSVIDEIHHLIIGNKETYKDIEKFEEIEQNDLQLKKREESVHYLMDYGDSSYVYPIASNDEDTILYAYLSSELKETIESMPNVASVNPPTTYEPDYDSTAASYSTTYDVKAIQEETKWNKVNVNPNSPLHLSMISQGKYDGDLVDEYDTNYYYPSSAGKDIDIFIFDSGFNFDHEEFSNKDEREAKCLIHVIDGKTVVPMNDEYCYSENLYENHGIYVSTVAGGLTYGVASKANIYGVLLESYDNVNAIAGLEYIRNHLFRPGKAVINFSFGGFTSMQNFTENAEYQYFQQLINEMSEEGAIFFSSAGNAGVDTFNSENNEIKDPCSFENEICVGGINSYEITSNYTRTKQSNFGQQVDIYAPYHAIVSFKSRHGRIWTENIRGTSFSTPMAAGVAATIMSENPKINFTSKSMLLYLTKMGERKVISDIPEDYPNVFLNNGKRTVYSKNDHYHGCGVHSGNQKCGSNECCSKDGQCVPSTSDLCKSTQGCQKEFGTCQVVLSTAGYKCGYGYGSCKEGYCCSAQGYCGQTNGHCGVGCQTDFGLCL